MLLRLQTYTLALAAFAWYHFSKALAFRHVDTTFHILFKAIKIECKQIEIDLQKKVKKIKFYFATITFTC